ncbi:MAG: hypothetical protein ACRC11_18100 [Xenococcaceae cyanobacterium]
MQHYPQPNYSFFLEKRELKYSYQDRHPEIKAIAEALRKKKGRKGLRVLAAEIGGVSFFEVDEFLKGAKLEPHQIEAVKRWLLNFSPEKPTCPFCNATVIPQMVDCLVCGHKT